MPCYDFFCNNCNKSYEIKMKLAEHDELKDKLECQECHEVMTQQVAGLKFKLAGNGWFDQGYGITNTETSSNLEEEKRIEERYHTALSKGEDL